MSIFSLLNKILILSYSPYDKTKGAHPRCVEMELLEEMAKTYFDFSDGSAEGILKQNVLLGMSDASSVFYRLAELSNL